MNSYTVSRRPMRGFTLLELMMVLAIIGILAVVALPSYRTYVNEARAARLLVNMDAISMAFHDVAATAPEKFADHSLLSSPAFGQPPSVFPGLSGAFASTEDVVVSAQMANHSGYFGYTGHGAFPVLFLKAESDHGRDMLRALDHVTAFKHTFVSPGLMMVALAMPHEVHAASTGPSAGPGITSGGAANTPTSGTPGSTPTGTITPKPTAPGTTIASTGTGTGTVVTGPGSGMGGGTLPPAGGSGSNPSGGSTSTGGQTVGLMAAGPATTNTGSGNSGAQGSSLGQSSTVHTVTPTCDMRGWPNGWIKHPQRHGC